MPLLLLPGGTPLLLWEIVPRWLLTMAVVWIAALLAARRMTAGSFAVSTAVDLPVLALLAWLPAAVLAVPPTVAGLEVPLSRAASLVFAIVMAYATAAVVSRPRAAWWAACGLLVAALGLAALSVVAIDWADELPRLAGPLGHLPRLVRAIPHATLQEAGLHPNNVAALELLALPLAVCCGWLPRPVRGTSELDPPNLLRPLARATALVVMLLLLATRSRGALAAAVLVLLWLAWRLRDRTRGPGGRRMQVAALGALALLAAVSWTGLPDPEAARETLGSRVALWRTSIELLRARPETGIGLNTFPLVYGTQRLGSARAPVYQGYAHAHNTLLQAALDYGLPGLAAVVGLYVATARAASRAHRRLRGTALEGLVLGLSLGLLAHVAHGLVDAVAIGARSGLLPWCYVGVVVGIRHYAHRWVPLPDDA